MGIILGCSPNKLLFLSLSLADQLGILFKRRVRCVCALFLTREGSLAVNGLALQSIQHAFALLLLLLLWYVRRFIYDNLPFYSLTESQGDTAIDL